MGTLLFTVILGFFLGMRHATDPDHVLAVTTIVSRQRSISYAALIGVLWGIGHTLTILAVGSAIIFFGLVIPPRLGLTMELSVGLMLIVLGAMNLTGTLNWIATTFRLFHAANDSHPHAHGSFAHIHLPVREVDPPDDPAKDSQSNGMDRSFSRLGFFHIFRPLAIGFVHGLAGSAAVALLVLATIRVPTWAVLYLLVFGVGTIAGMMLITAAIAVPFTYTKARSARLSRCLSLFSGVASLAFGAFIVFQNAVVNGLFSHAPKWIPR